MVCTCSKVVRVCSMRSRKPRSFHRLAMHCSSRGRCLFKLFPTALDSDLTFFFLMLKTESTTKRWTPQNPVLKCLIPEGFDGWLERFGLHERLAKGHDETI